MSSATWYEWQGNRLILTVHIQPRAKHNEIVGPHGDALKIRLTAPPVDGKANEALCNWIAEVCAVSKNQVTLLCGLSGRRKRVAIDGPCQLPLGVRSQTG